MFLNKTTKCICIKIKNKKSVIKIQNKKNTKYFEYFTGVHIINKLLKHCPNFIQTYSCLNINNTDHLNLEYIEGKTYEFYTIRFNEVSSNHSIITKNKIYLCLFLGKIDCFEPKQRKTDKLKNKIYTLKKL